MEASNWRYRHYWDVGRASKGRLGTLQKTVAKKGIAFPVGGKVNLGTGR